MPSKNRPMSSASSASALPSGQQRNESSSRSAQAIATTRCRCRGRKSLPVRARRSRNANSATSRSATLLSMPWSRRRPATSGTVSMSNARSGVIRGGSRRAFSVGEHARGEITIAAVADDGHDGRVLDLARDPERDRERAARGNPGEDAFLARHAPRHVLGVRLADVLEPVDARLIVDLRQVRFGPLADPGYLRALLGLAADDLDLGVLLLEEARAAHDGAGRAHARDEVRERAPGVTPDLRPGALVVGERVVGVGELVEDAPLA